MAQEHPLKLWRKKAGLTGSQLGAKLGLSKTAISLYENGHAFPRKNTLKKIEEVTAGFVTVADFMQAEAAE